MPTEEFWQKIQQGMGYTDEEMRLARASPYRSKALAAGPKMVRQRVIAEIVDAKNCVAHPVGTRYVIRANGIIQTGENPPKLCLLLLTVLLPAVQVTFDRLAQGGDLGPDWERFYRCPDAGVECGGFGRVTVKVTAEQQQKRT